MAVPPDPDTPTTPSPTAPQEGGDLTLNGSTRAADVDAILPDPPLDQAQQPGVNTFFTDEVDRSWLSGLLSFKASWHKEHLLRNAGEEPTAIQSDTRSPAGGDEDANRSGLSGLLSNGSLQKEQVPPSAPAEPVTMQSVSNLDEYLDSLAALRAVCMNIDVRLARIEHATRQSEGAAIQTALHDLCSQTYDRLARVEAAVQRTEGIVAEKHGDLSTAADQRLERIEETVRLCVDIDKQLVQTRMALQRTEEAAADKTLHQLCQNIETRLARVEESLHRTESVVVERIQELCARMTARFGEIEQTVRFTPKSLADLMLPTIEAQIVQARMALQRTEKAVADQTVHELCRNIDVRLEQTEDMLHRSESIVAEWLRELSARMNARFAEVDEAIQRIERIVSSSTVAQTPSQRPAEQIVDLHVRSERTKRTPGAVTPVLDLRSRALAILKNGKSSAAGLVAPAIVFVRRSISTKQPILPIRLPWTAGLAVPVLILVAAFAIQALIRPGRGVIPVAEKVAPRTTSNQFAATMDSVTNEAIQERPPTTVMANAPRSTRERLVSLASQRPTIREPEHAATPVQTFVGTLSIASVPSGASVVINGKPAGVTPLRLSRQRAGSHAIQIAHEGFERWSAAVLVPADRLTQVTAKLRAAAR